MQWLVWQPLHSHIPGVHVQKVLTLFLHPRVVQRCCWYICGVLVTHLRSTSFDACFGAIRNSCTLLCSFKGEPGPFCRWSANSLCTHCHPSARRKPRSVNCLFAAIWGGTKYQMMRKALTSESARRNAKTRFSQRIVTHVSSNDGSPCRRLLWSSTAW